MTEVESIRFEFVCLATGHDYRSWLKVEGLGEGPKSPR